MSRPCDLNIFQLDGNVSAVTRQAKRGCVLFLLAYFFGRHTAPANADLRFHPANWHNSADVEEQPFRANSGLNEMMNKSRIAHATVLTLWATILSACATMDSSDTHQPTSEFRYTLSTGLFSLPQNAKSVDWAIINNTASVQKFRVTVYQFDAGGKVPVTPGPIANTVRPFHTFHNANSVGYQKPFANGRDYEVVLEVNSMKVLPSVEVWADHGNTVIPGTFIGPGQFVDISQ